MGDAAEDLQEQATEQQAGDQDRKVPQITVRNMAFAEHAFRRHQVIAPDGCSPEDLEHPKFWANVAQRLSMGDEVRVVDDGYTWVANVFISFVQGTNVRAKVMSGCDLESVDPDDLAPDVSDDYECKLKGPRKWCIVKISTGEVIKEGIPTQKDAYKELDDFVRALRQ